MTRFLAYTLPFLLAAAPCAAKTYSADELKGMFQRSVETEDLRERERLRAAIAKAAPDSAYGLASRAYLQDSRITRQESIAIYTRALELDPTIAAAYYNRGNAHLRLGQYDKAERDYAKAISLGFKKAMAYSGLANAQAGQKRDGEAEENFTKSLRMDPAQPFAYNNRGSIYLQRGEYDKAIADLDAALRLSRFAMAYMNRGDAWAGKKEFRKALADYAAAEDLVGGDPDLRVRRGNVYLKIPDYAKAREEFGLLLSDEPGNAAALRGLGHACFYLKDYDCAEDAYRRAIAANPESAAAYSALAATYQNKKRMDLAEETLKRGVARLPGNKELKDKLLSVQVWKGNAKGTEDPLTGVIASGKAGAEDYFNRGEARLESKDYKGAEADLKEALRRSPDSASSTVYLALAFLGSGRRPEALELFASVADTDPARLAKLRKGAARADAGPGGNVRALLKRMLALYDGEEEGTPARTKPGRENSGHGTAQEDCFCIHYTGGTPPYFLAKAPGAPSECKNVKLKPDPSKPGIGGLRNCREFLKGD